MLTSLTLSLSPSILPLSRVNSLDSMRREEGSEPGTLNMIGHCVDRAAHHGTCGGGGGGGATEGPLCVVDVVVVVVVVVVVEVEVLIKVERFVDDARHLV